jgi:hypothetical protein
VRDPATLTQGSNGGPALVERGTSPIDVIREESRGKSSSVNLSQKDAILSPLHVGEGDPDEPCDKDPKIAILEAEILALRGHIEMLEREMEAKSKRRFICF